MRKRYSLSLGTIFSLIIIYFIFLYSRDQSGSGWSILAFVAKWYLIIVIGFSVLGILIYLLMALFILGIFLYAKMGRKKPKNPHIYDASYREKKD